MGSGLLRCRSVNGLLSPWTDLWRMCSKRLSAGILLCVSFVLYKGSPCVEESVHPCVLKCAWQWTNVTELVSSLPYDQDKLCCVNVCVNVFFSSKWKCE
jgi:hypothetical protein